MWQCRESVAKLRQTSARVDIPGSFQVPLEIIPPGGVERPCRGIIVQHGILGRVALPFFYFGMSVGKGKATGAVVVGRGDILPGGGVRIVNEKAIINRVWVFIED